MTYVLDATQFAPSERRDAIRHVIWSSVVRVEIDYLDDEPVLATCSLGAAGSITYCTAASTAATIHRTARLARDDLEPSVFLGLQVSGSSMVIQDGREAVLGAGDMALYDTTRPYTLVNDGPTEHHYFRVPRAALALPETRVRAAVARTLGGRRGINAAASAYFSQLVTAARSEAASGTLEAPTRELVRALVLNATGGAVPAPRPDEVLLASARQHIDRHLSDAAMSPTGVAAAQHVSVRRLYEAFAATGTPVAAWIRTRRLEACRRDLAGSGAQTVTVAAIGRRWGFVSASHFSRAFTAEFGCSPSEWRSAATHE